MDIARTYFANILQQADAMLKPWRDAVVGDPVLVRTVELDPSYWIVPVVRYGQVLGYIDVGPRGQVLGYAYLYRSPDDLSPCPPVVTRLSAEEAYKQAEEILSTYPDAEFTDPVFVHDGPRNRLAWMIEVRVGGELATRVFVTPGYVYQRKPEEKPPPPGWRGGLP